MHGLLSSIIHIPGRRIRPSAVLGTRTSRPFKHLLAKLLGSFWPDKSLRHYGKRKKCRQYSARWQALPLRARRRHLVLQALRSTKAGSLARSTWRSLLRRWFKTCMPLLGARANRKARLPELVQHLEELGTDRSQEPTGEQTYEENASSIM